MSEEIKNTPEEIEAVKAEDLEDTVEKENDAEAVIEEISTEPQLKKPFCMALPPYKRAFLRLGRGGQTPSYGCAALRTRVDRKAFRRRSSGQSQPSGQLRRRQHASQRQGGCGSMRQGSSGV